MTRLAQLDLAQNPESYLSIQPADGQRRAASGCTVGNRTSVAVTDVSIVVAVVNSSGQAVDGPSPYRHGKRLRCRRGKSVNLQTPLGPFSSGDVLSAVRWKVESARVAQ